MPGIKTSKDRLTLLKPVIIYHSENCTALKNYARSTLPVFCKWNKKDWMTVHLFTKWLTKYFKPTLRRIAQEKKVPLKALLLVNN